MARTKRNNPIKEEIIETNIVPETVEEVSDEPIVGYVISSKLNVREAADINSNIINVVDMGTKLILKSKDIINGFYELDKGFVMAEYVNV